MAHEGPSIMCGLTYKEQASDVIIYNVKLWLFTLIKLWESILILKMSALLYVRMLKTNLKYLFGNLGSYLAN